MKNKIALASAFVAASGLATAEIVINDFLSFEGFIDMSYAHVDGEFADDDYSDNSFQVDQVEISWLFDFDTVTAQIDIEYEDADSDVNVEQAFATYHFDNGSALTAGRYASMLGFEAFEPTGLYQFSTAYSLPSVDILGGFAPTTELENIVGNAITPVGERYAQGVKYTYEDESMFFGLSLQDGTVAYADRLGGNDDFDDDDGGYGIEAAFAYDFGNGFAYFLGASFEDGDGVDDGFGTSGDTEAYVVNTYVTYETGAWFFAAELNYGETEVDEIAGGVADLEIESLSALIMANFAYSEQASVTGRISYVDVETETDFVASASEIDGDFVKFTLAHNYAFTDNLALVTEVSYTDGEVDGSSSEDFEELLGAVELIFSF